MMNICFTVIEVDRVREITAFILLILFIFPSVIVADAADIVLVPPEPMAGKNLVFYIPSINGSANGYVMCNDSNNVHLIRMEDGFAQVALNEDDYGNATVKIFASNRTYTKNFVIRPFLSGSIAIESPSSVLVDTDTSVKVVAGVDPANGATMTFTSPSGRSFNRVSDEKGMVAFSFDEEGSWEIQAMFYGIFASAKIDIMLPPISIVFSEEVSMDEEMKISVGCPADVTIRKDEVMWTYRTDANGDLYFTPPWPGKYSVYVKTDKQEGSKTFTTVSETRIDVYDYKNSIPVSTVKKDQLVRIVVVDPSGVPLSEVKRLFIYCDNSLWDTLHLSKGSVVWAVDKEATVYRFEVEETDLFTPSETMVYGMVEQSLSGDIIFYLELIAIIVVLLILIFYLHRTKRIRMPKIFAGRGISLHGRKLE